MTQHLLEHRTTVTTPHGDLPVEIDVIYLACNNQRCKAVTMKGIGDADGMFAHNPVSDGLGVHFCSDGCMTKGLAPAMKAHAERKEADTAARAQALADEQARVEAEAEARLATMDAVVERARIDAEHARKHGLPVPPQVQALVDLREQLRRVGEVWETSKLPNDDRA